MDKLYISELRVPCHIGVHAWEQKIKQTLILDIELRVDLSKAAQSAQLADTVDYSSLIQRIKALLTQSFALIETVAEVVASAVLEEPAVFAVTVKVAKPSISSELKTVAVEITRTLAC